MTFSQAPRCCGRFSAMIKRILISSSMLTLKVISPHLVRFIIYRYHISSRLYNCRYEALEQRYIEESIESMERLGQPISIGLVIIHLFKAEPPTVYNHQNSIASDLLIAVLFFRKRIAPYLLCYLLFTCFHPMSHILWYPIRPELLPS